MKECFVGVLSFFVENVVLEIFDYRIQSLLAVAITLCNPFK